MRRTVRRLALCSLLVASSAITTSGPLLAQGGRASGWQPWPTERHDLQRTGRTRVVGPRHANLDSHYPLESLLPPPARIGIVSDPAVGRSGEAFVTAGWCLNEVPFFGCIGGQWFTVLALGPSGAVRVVAADGTRRFRGTPALGPDGTIYVREEFDFGRAGTIALTPAGAILWSRSDGEVQGVAPDGAVLVLDLEGTSSGPRSMLRRLDPATGGTLSEFVLPRPAHAPVAIGTDGSIYFNAFDADAMANILVAVNPDGTERWHRPTGSQATTGPVVARDGGVFFAGRDVRAFGPDGTLLWIFAPLDPVELGSKIALARGTLYVQTKYELAAVASRSGRVRWRRPMAAGPNPRLNPAVGGDGTVYSASASHVRAFTPRGTLLWSHAIPDTPGGKAGAAIGADGTLFVVGNSNGYSFAR